MSFNKLTLSIFIALLLLITTFYESFATVITPPERQDQVEVSVKFDVQFDSATKLYTYTYTVTSLPTSKQEIDSFEMEVEGEITNILSPDGWMGLMND